MQCPIYCNEIKVLHTTPKKWIPKILQEGFKLPKEVPSQHSWGKGSAEEDIIFFERDNRRGARYIFGWIQNLEGSRDLKNGIISASLCSCNHLDKQKLANNKHNLAMKGTQFIMNAQGYKESKRAWAEDFLGGRLETYDEPFEFLRKIANDASHGIYDAKGKMIDVKRYDIGEVMTYLGFDSADGSEASHIFSPDKDDRIAPTNEIIATNTKLISNLNEITPQTLCKEYMYDEKMATLCEKMGLL